MVFITPDAAALAPAALGDDALLDAQKTLASSIRTLESASSRVAAEIARRSSRDLGYEGLAQRLGARTPERLVQLLSGSSLADARRLVRVGTATEPWLAPADGLGVQQIDAIRSGLASTLSPEILEPAVAQLAAEATSLDVDALARRAREVRDELDASSVAHHEEVLRSQRFLRLTPLPTGMTRVSGLLDPESAAIVVGAVDAITAPRRGGPRFVSQDEPSPLPDERTIDQLTVDALVDIVAVATRAPLGQALRQTQPGGARARHARRPRAPGGPRVPRRSVRVGVGRDGRAARVHKRRDSRLVQRRR